MITTPRVPLDALATHDVVLCAGGPLTCQVFFAGQLADLQRATARARNPHTPPAALRVLQYHPSDRDTSQQVRAKKGVYYTARVIRYRPLETVR